MRRELTVTVDVTHPMFGDSLEEIAAGMRAEYLHPGSVVCDLILSNPGGVGESFVATLTEYDDHTGDVRTTTLWSTAAGDWP